MPTPPEPDPMRPGETLEELEAEARYRRERLQLYRARAYSAKPTTTAGRQERERLSEHAERRLRQARQQRSG